MTDIVFRSPEDDEIEQVSAQITESYTSAYQGMMLQAYLDSLSCNHWVPILKSALACGDTCIIAEVGGRIVGSVVYGKSEADPTIAAWHSIYLLPTYIGEGIGHRLYCYMEEKMRSQGFYTCELEVLSQNERAIRFYTDRGYSLVNIFEIEENGMRLECRTMRKNLVAQ